MKWRVVIIPLLIVLGGVVTASMVPLDGRLKAAIVAMDCFAATAVGLILWRAQSSR